MHLGDEQENENRRDMEIKVERFLDHSQFYLNRLPLLKRQLNEINRLHQFDLYVQKLNDIDKIVHDLAQNIRNIEQLHLQLNEKDRLKLDRQIRLLRSDIDREMAEFHVLREQAMAASVHEEILSTNNDDTNIEQDTTTNELRQRHITTNHLNDSYDLLEKDLIVLRETIGEVAQLVAQQQQTISNTEHLINIAHEQIRSASTLLQKAVQNRYLTIASGALLGASLGGPVGFVMGIKIGALAALSGSAVGALSMNLMQQRMAANSQPNENANSAIAYNQAML